MSEEREKRSWREIDRMRDHGGGGSRGERRPRRNDRSSERYKSMLDKAFERGEMGEVMDKLSGSVPAASEAASGKPKKRGPSRQKLLHAITTADTPSKALEAFEKFRSAFGLPDDTDALLPGLDHDDQAVVLEVLEKLEQIVSEQGRPRRYKTLLARLRMIEDDFNAEADVQQAASRLARQL